MNPENILLEALEKIARIEYADPALKAPFVSALASFREACAPGNAYVFSNAIRRGSMSLYAGLLYIADMNEVRR